MISLKTARLNHFEYAPIYIRCNRLNSGFVQLKNGLQFAIFLFRMCVLFPWLWFFRLEFLNSTHDNGSTTIQVFSFKVGMWFAEIPHVTSSILIPMRLKNDGDCERATTRMLYIHIYISVCICAKLWKRINHFIIQKNSISCIFFSLFTFICFHSVVRRNKRNCRKKTSAC